MAQQSPKQTHIVERVMHEFKHGELRSGPEGKAGKVRNPKQAIAIALKEAGASRNETEADNKRNLARTKRRDRGGTERRARDGGGATRADLYRRAQEREIPGRSRMSKAELEKALR